MTTLAPTALYCDTTQPFLLAGGDFDSSKRFESSQVLDVIYPADGNSLVGRCAMVTEAHLEAICQAAQNGFDLHKKTTPTQRSEILSKLAIALKENLQEAARLITLETGKPLKLATVEVQRAIGVFEGYAEFCKWQPAQQFFIEGRQCQVKHFPLGPVIAVCPYNFPLNLVVHKLAPAIAAGNSITIKPASKTPLIALFIGRLAQEAGYQGVSVIPCKSSLAEKLVKSDVFKKFSFTGSSDIGWYLKSQAGKKVVTLELGGNAGCIIESLDEKVNGTVESVAHRVAQGAFWLSGQSCISVQRLFVQKQYYDAFVLAIKKAANALKVGDPLDINTDIGAMISPEEVSRSHSWVKEAVQQGACLEAGGITPTPYSMTPTVLTKTTAEMKVNAQECFAPIMTVIPYELFEDALAMCNDATFGLQAGVYTTNGTQAQLAYETLEVGGVIINDIPTFRLDALPYGGIKDSGLGREGILTGVAEMSYLKTCIAK
jgi:acyl-CoA reductase-like NAD-dependent aldehyde dehydrogenase